MSRFVTFVKSRNTNIFKLSSMNFAYWSTFAAYYPFLAIYLANKGFSNTQTGLILAINSFIAVLAQPFWGLMSDWLRSVRKVFLICFAVSSVLWLSLSFLESLFIIPIMFVVLTFFESSLPSLTDNWIIQGIRNENMDFGRIRFLGSVGFGIMVYINGLLVEKSGLGAIYYSYLILAVITFSIVLRSHSEGKSPVIKLKDLKVSKLFKNYHYITFLIFATILFIPHKSAYTYLPKLMEMVGGSKIDYGLAVSLLALSEIPFFIFSGYLLRKFKPVHLMLASTVFFILKQYLFLISSSPLHVILVCILQGPSFALFLTGTMYYIDDQTPDELKFTAQLIGSAVFSGISGIAGNFGGGLLIDMFGLDLFYKSGTVISIIISLVFLLSLQLGKKITCSACIRNNAMLK